MLRALADNTESSSYATKLRQKRFHFFTTLISKLDRPLRILDVGGTEVFWIHMGFESEPDVQITLLNVVPTAVTRESFESVIADGRDLSRFGDKSFDVVFSNSVIEHLSTDEDQENMAREIQRVAKSYFVQTPNFYFPIEPHFLFPCFQFLPVSFRTFLLQHFKLGWVDRVPERDKAEEVVRGVRLLTKSMLQRLFPAGEIYHERFLGLTKSFVVYGGWE